MLMKSVFYFMDSKQLLMKLKYTLSLK